MSYLFHYDKPSAADDGDEQSIQVRLRARCKMLAPSMRLIATPNGMKTTAWSALKAKSEGMTKGMPDLTALATGGFVAFLEIKDRHGSLKPEQIDMLNWLHRCGFPAGCFRSVDTAVDFLRQHGAPIVKDAA